MLVRCGFAADRVFLVGRGAALEKIVSIGEKWVCAAALFVYAARWVTCTRLCPIRKYQTPIYSRGGAHFRLKVRERIQIFGPTCFMRDRNIMKINYATADALVGRAQNIIMHQARERHREFSRDKFSSFSDGRSRSIMRVMRINSLVILSSLPFV